MEAIIIKEFGGVEKLQLTTVPTPKPTDNEVLIEIHDSGVNPVDWKIREGLLKSRLPHEFPLILGWEAAGRVDAIGKKVKNFKVGDEVYAYCRKPTVKEGTYAEYICLDAQNVALKPKSLSYAQAASIPLAGLTAWQSLFDSANLQKGETVLIHAGAGGVGGFAIQFAKNAGATVYTTAGQENHDYVKKLGADEAIDYKKENFASKMKTLCPKGVDVIFDTVGGKTFHDSLALLKPGGRIVSLLEHLEPADAAKRNIKASYVFVSPNAMQLKQIGDLINKGKVKTPKIEEIPLNQAAEALEKIRKGHTCGKIVLKVK